MDVLHHNNRIVDDESDGDGQAAHRHQVDRSAEDAHEDEGRNHGHRQRDGGDGGQARVPQEDHQDDDGEKAADQDGVANVLDRGSHELGEVVDLRDGEAGRQRFRQRRQRLVDAALQARMFAPICCEMLTDTASRPLPVMRSVRSGEPGNT